MRAASHTVSRDSAATVERIFDVVVAEDVLPKVLRRWGPIPAVTSTRDLTGPWDIPGSRRTVVLGDGNTAREQVLVWERPHRFEYRVDEITGVLGRSVDHAIGVWRFAPAGAGSGFEWIYTFHPRNRTGAVILPVLARTAWARYMAACADRCVALAEGGSPG